MSQKGVLLPHNVDLVQAQDSQMDLTHAICWWHQGQNSSIANPVCKFFSGEWQSWSEAGSIGGQVTSSYKLVSTQDCHSAQRLAQS